MFTRLSADDEKDLENVLSIYSESFPSNERHAADTIRQRVILAQYSCIVGRAQQEIVFFALLWPLRGSEFILLDYMATKSGYRGSGIGAEFLKSIPSIPEMAGKYLLLEVERPGCGENREQRARRLEFYRRAGAAELQGVPYVMPGLSGGAPTEMLLMTLPKMEGGIIAGKSVRKAIIQIYAELYGRGVDDDLLNTIIEKVPEEVRLI